MIEPADMNAPHITVIVACYNAAATIEATLRSVLAQTLRDLEIVVIDDASRDDSADRVAAIAATDARVRLERLPANGGVSAARSRAIDLARGAWCAVVDSDDLLHPDRLARMLRAAGERGADIVADDMLEFADDNSMVPRLLFGFRAPQRVGLAEYADRNRLYTHEPALGYLKPLMRTALLREHAIRYNPNLRVAEDYDLVARLLAVGAQFDLLPGAGYFYRKHAGSVSHRLNVPILQAMLDEDATLRRMAPNATPADHRALDRRLQSIRMALHFEILIDALKRRDLRGAVTQALRDPAAAALLRLPVFKRLGAVFKRRVAPVEQTKRGKQICLISRQRLVGAINGSSTYLLSICAYLRARGFELHLVQPSPAVFGRWPALRMGPDMAVFRSIRIRGAWRLGDWFIARDPRILLPAALAVLERLAMRAGVLKRPVLQPAPYAVSVPWNDADRLFVARHARPHADALLIDYAFLTEAVPHALRPDAPSVTIMHDLFFRRAGQFARLNAADSVASLTETDEMQLLAQADFVAAIQPEEAAYVGAAIGPDRVVVVPMAVAPLAAPQSGGDMRVLFVGSGAAPNVQGLQWFLAACWPAIRAAIPAARLDVAGSVCGKIASPPAGVALLGVVPDLAPLYRDAAVVVAPLQAGSGLKIKLIEALGQGKAVVATSVTAQGVEAEIAGAVAVHDDADGFARAVIGLLQNPDARHATGLAALHAAHAHFSADACYGRLADILAGAAT